MAKKNRSTGKNVQTMAEQFAEQTAKPEAKVIALPVTIVETKLLDELASNPKGTDAEKVAYDLQRAKLAGKEYAIKYASIRDVIDAADMATAELSGIMVALGRAVDTMFAKNADGLKLRLSLYDRWTETAGNELIEREREAGQVITGENFTDRMRSFKAGALFLKHRSQVRQGLKEGVRFSEVDKATGIYVYRTAHEVARDAKAIADSREAAKKKKLADLGTAYQEALKAKDVEKALKLRDTIENLGGKVDTSAASAGQTEGKPDEAGKMAVDPDMPEKARAALMRVLNATKHIGGASGQGWKQTTKEGASKLEAAVVVLSRCAKYLGDIANGDFDTKGAFTSWNIADSLPDAAPDGAKAEEIAGEAEKAAS